MTTMLERAAMAAAAADATLHNGPDLYKINPDLYLRLTRAVLMAVREPDEDVMERANDVLFDLGEPPACRAVHAAMIDAILADGEGR